MAQFPYWGGDTVAESAWDVMWLGGTLLPGIIENCVARKSRKVDEASPKGADGVVTTDNGYGGGTVEFDLLINGREQWEAFQDALPTFDPQKPGAQVSPLEILHPEPNAIGIKTIRVTDITGSMPQAGGRKKYHFSCVQWLPALKNASSGKRAKAKQTPDRSPIQDIQIIVPDFMSNTFR